MRKLLLVSLIFFCLLSFSAISTQATDVCSRSDYLVAYINGINTLKKDARHDAFDVLSEAIGDTRNGEQITVILAYNQTRGAMFDLVDVFAQKINEYPQVSSDLIFKALISGIFSSAIPQSLKDFITSYHINKIRDSGFVSYNDGDLQDIVGAIRAKMNEGRKILLVPHSQGNLYANAAYDVLTSGTNAVSKSAIGIVGIASPAAYVAGDGDYLTSSNDLVVGGLRACGLSVLAANFTISISSDDLLGHSLSDIYLNANLEGRVEIVERIYAAMDSLVFPSGGASQGPITVTLTWGAQPDVDLHVFEPDGTHVFYRSKTGTVGSLDQDDITSYGPEHYYTECGNLKTGVYTIGLNYYNGSGTETAVITIATPVSIVTRSVELTTAVGSAGDGSPIFVGKIKVSKTASGVYSYEII
jgi:hypothetical protein